MPRAIHTKNTHFAFGSTFVERETRRIWLPAIRFTSNDVSPRMDTTDLCAYLESSRNAMYLTMHEKCVVAF